MSAAALRARDARPAPVEAGGERAAHVVTFARVLGGEAALVIAPRLVLTRSGDAPPLGAVWGDTRLALSPALAGLRLRGVFDGATLLGASSEPRLADVLRRRPVALFVSEPKP